MKQFQTGNFWLTLLIVGLVTAALAYGIARWAADRIPTLEAEGPKDFPMTTGANQPIDQSGPKVVDPLAPIKANSRSQR
ncbi:MAG: hypothetical protein AKCLJLPJ_00926 [Fimbriimonadales bacterium]|nr:MAG: hypothetical protein EDM73_04365 [Armatimonadota bacterium]MBV6502870.1 hypothetical protein [Fimbriimonadales bacterium]MCE7899225.1 hypothetical protein [Armatimonadetes bacterium ATM1]MDL1929008.1 hypothetical protein [Fimbriimonadia bacterium ATM]MBC6969437.1 hypothetical protein [Armatimonadota bacterium]